MFEQAPLGIAISDSLTGKLYQIDTKSTEIVGREIEETAGIDWMSTTHPGNVKEI
ncbi:hypothetical protein [Desulfosporosinus shakirovi]|uniref:hypothetical protein n=1 Tax=Desulfosporosinus shakirovi TaxID=2885154 RepID=UPI001E488705|nr:hypothetical protein [Desulfosporosinus sp. SRJS8]MCB8818683.1 hypothetical protein [Desulfosporosinus sp. SRJS8]